ncbi:heavy metal translocating P-type ATPase [Leucobacter sp. UT-8R-CII-1-4]|uniref:heavy metal translocating P-type ATPase n=1 Tax=Leucobacter sp. UT-8R-CII-1-4 TaxID=3040075 RepID=UPI0024A7EDE9|nr:heavy metal translocating P-type ATPase [Leucobacter sp. UT-8R-CII-1-4]MDI6024161.1 heavy metal translocating P-type ATPase [Leucobacter sp. UT-8R-CII-1-4]
MNAFRRAIRSYPLVATTLVVAVVGLLMLATPARDIAPWVVGIYALAIAACEAVQMVRSLLKGNLGLDILAVTAITAAVLVGEPWAAIVVVLMLTGGEALENYAENRSKRELVALLDRAPRQATRVIGGMPTDAESAESLEVVPVDAIAINDVLLVRPGEVVPVDALLLSPSASFDESSLTGESLPVDRAAGEVVSSGVVNGSTAIYLRAKALASDSQYQQIVALVERAQESKAPTVRLADRYAVPFTLLSLGIAAAAWIVSGNPTRFAEVLVVATPCPLLIAAPVAFLGGMSRAARHGLIVKGGGTLEQLARVRSAAFDKTGTLTTGRPKLTRMQLAEGVSEDQLLQFAASAEVYSSHVLAAAIVQTAKDRGLEILAMAEAQEFATNGVEATLEEALETTFEAAFEQTSEPTSESATAMQSVVRGKVRVGKPAWVAEAANDLVRVELEPGELAIYVAVDARFAGALIMRDALRPEALSTVQQLEELGLDRMLIVTGDVEATARSVGDDLGIAEVHAECTPADKVKIAASITPRPLIMTGDGLNDAPVLAAADVGFAMGARGATAASESADIVNRFDTIAGVADAVRIGRDTVRIALQSIWLGILLSVALMLVAAFGFLPALVGAWMQELVDLVAILGALRAIGTRADQKFARTHQGPTQQSPRVRQSQRQPQH